MLGNNLNVVNENISKSPNVPKSVSLSLVTSENNLFIKFIEMFKKIIFISCPSFSEAFSSSFYNYLKSSLHPENSSSNGIRPQLNIFMKNIAK